MHPPARSPDLAPPDLDPVPSWWYLLLGSVLLLVGGSILLVAHSHHTVLAGGLTGSMGLLALVFARMSALEERRARALGRERARWPVLRRPRSPVTASATAPPRAPVGAPLPALPVAEVVSVTCGACGYQAGAVRLDAHEAYETLACRACEEIVTVSWPRTHAGAYPHAAKVAQHHARDRCARPDLVGFADLHRVSCPKCRQRALSDTVLTDRL